MWKCDGPYPLLSSAISAGLYHPRCKDSHTTYFPELHEDDPPEPVTKSECKQLADQYQKEQKQQYAERQAEKYGRMAEFMLDPENEKRYAAQRDLWAKSTKASPFIGRADGVLKKSHEVFGDGLAMLKQTQ